MQLSGNSLSLKHYWKFIIIYIVFSGICLLTEFYWGLAIPIVFFLTLTGILAFDKLVLISVFFTPLSVRYENVIAGVGLDIPTDIFLLTLGFCSLIIIMSYDKFPKEIIKHPLTILLILYIIWIYITSITSTMPLISFKYAISRTLFQLVYFLIMTQVFRKIERIHVYMWAYIIPLSAVIIYAFNVHYEYNFDQRASYGIAQPFYVNHGIYAAAIAMFIPYFFLLIFSPSVQGISKTVRWVSTVFFLLFLMGLIFSFTRAAWLSIALSFAVGAILLFKFKFSSYLFFLFILIIGLFSFNDQIEKALRKNKTVSGDDFSQHLKSIYNVKNDDSNLERINRWMSALRMTREKPVFGFGPGTYTFQYASYQRSSEITAISTNLATLGNCHSEYLQPMAETGIPGLLIWIIIIGYLFYTGIFTYNRTHGQSQLLVFSALLGLVTYFVHGILNNYIELDKAAVLIWPFMAIIVSINTYHLKKTQPN